MVRDQFEAIDVDAAAVTAAVAAAVSAAATAAISAGASAVVYTAENTNSCCCCCCFCYFTPWLRHIYWAKFLTTSV